MRKQIQYLLFAITILLLAACSSAPAPTPPPIVAEEPSQPAEPAAAIEIEEASESDADDDMAEDENSSQSDVANEEEEKEEEAADMIETSEMVEEDTAAIDAAGSSFSADSLIVDISDPVSEAEYILNVVLPTEPTSSVSFSHPPITIDSQIAFQELARIGFPGPLYQEFISAEVRSEELTEWARPFYAFRGNEILTIMAGSVFYENRDVISQYPSTLPFEEARTLTEAQIAAWGGFDFDYVIVEDTPGTTAVKRLVNGRPVDHGEAYFNYNNDGELVFASLSILHSIIDNGETPIMSATAAWDIVNQRQFDFNEVTYSFDYSNQPIPTEPDFVEIDYLSWYQTPQPGNTVDIYGYPLLYLPVEDDGEPYIQLNEYTVQAPATELRAMAGEGIYQVKVTGTIANDGNTFILDQWENANDLYTEFHEGSVTRDGENGILTTVEGENFFIPNLPTDFPETLDTYVNGWLVEQGDAPYPVIEWLNLDEAIPYDETGLEADIAILPVEPIGVFEPIESITIESVELGHSYIVDWDELGEDQGYEIAPSHFAPTWFFTGTADTGERITFSVKASLD